MKLQNNQVYNINHKHIQPSSKANHPKTPTHNLTNNQDNTTMSTGKTPTSPAGNEGDSQSPLPNLDPASTPNPNHYPDCPGCLAEAEAAADQHPRPLPDACACPACSGGATFPPFPLVCGDASCPNCGPRLPPFPPVYEDPTCSQCHRLAVSGCQCPSCLGLMAPFGIGLRGQQQSMVERDRILAENAHFMAEEDRHKEERRIARERTTRPKSATLMALQKAMDEGERLENAMTHLGLYPPSDPTHKSNQERRTSTAVPAHFGATSGTETNVDRMVMQKGETRFGTAGSMCACGDRTCPGGMGAGPTQQSIANAGRFEERVATRGLSGGMLPPGLYPPPIDEVPGPSTLPSGWMFAPPAVPMVPMPRRNKPGPNHMWPGHMFAPRAAPMVPMPSKDLPGPNNTWPGCMFAPTSVPMVPMPLSSLPGPNNMWPDRMFAPRSGPVPEQRQPEIDMQRDDEVLRDARRDHERADERLTYLQRELAKKEQQVATLKAETQRLMDDRQKREEKMVKLGRKFFLQLDAEDEVKATKQEPTVAWSHLVAAEMACEEAGHDYQSFERHDKAVEQGSVKESKGKGKEVAHDDVRQHAKEHESGSTPKDTLDNGSPHPVWSDGTGICRDCGGRTDNSDDDGGQNVEARTLV